jgi:hypothetical protein
MAKYQPGIAARELPFAAFPIALRVWEVGDEKWSGSAMESITE